MKKSNKYISALAGCMLLAGITTGCSEDKYLIQEEQDPITQIGEDEYALGVTLSVDQLLGSSGRALSDLGSAGLKEIEEYVNTENLYVLFFDIHGTFLFNINKPTAIPIGQGPSGLDNQWFIKIPVKEINDNLIKYIEENPFKIAVLANWTFDADINTGGTWDAFEFHSPLDEEGNLVYDDFGRLKGDHISLLSHAQLDKVYDNLENHGYDHLAYETSTGNHMGPYIEWVHNYHRSIAQAESDIRLDYNVVASNGCEANTYKTSDSENHYNVIFNKLWHLWNFGGKDDSMLGIDAGSKRTDWLTLNDKAKSAMVKNSDDVMDFKYESHTWSMPDYEELYLSPGIGLNHPGKLDNSNYLDFNGVVLTSQNITKGQSDSGEPLRLEPDNSSGNNRHYINFKANADGYVRVNYEAQGGAILMAHIGLNNTPENNASGYLEDNQKNRSEVPVLGEGVFGDIPFQPKDVYLYMVKGENPTGNEGDEGYEAPQITIYSIEYIESRHLYDVDRRGILPSKDYPIPMYGLQDFDPIGEYWQPGILFNLSMFNNAQKLGYNYRTISLLRSLSRIEVRLSKADFPKKPAHVFMRSMNRSARITPVDFFTPTDIIWNGFNPSDPNDVRRMQNYVDAGNVNEQEIIRNTPGYVQEEANIMQYGPIYIGSNANNGQDANQKMDEYRKTTAWPFGIWEQQWGWDWNRGNGVVRDFETYKPGQTRAHTGQVVPEYPRILHTRISRSDYARMTEVEDGAYWHYIMYLPEKNITDADNPGNIADRPKIIHIELRFNGGLPELDNADDNFVDNFDDNGAYRLYFTPGGRANLGSFNFTGRESWDAYEYDWNIASQHWPIIRNHIYTFTVNGGLGNRGSVDFRVTAPDRRYVNWDFY